MTSSNKHRKFDEIRMSNSWDMHANRQTDRQTDNTPHHHYTRAE